MPRNGEAGHVTAGYGAIVLPVSVPSDLPAAPRPAGSQASPAVRLVTGFAGFGAGSVNLAISSSSLASAGASNPGLLIAAAVAGLWGLALLAGAVLFLARDRPAGRPGQYALAAAAAAHLGAIVLPGFAPAGLGLTQLSALLLTLMIIASLAWLRRAEGSRDRRLPAASQRAGIRPGRLLLAAFAGAVLVAGITTPGLAASTAGQYAVPHGEHGNLSPGGHHQH